MYGLALVLVLSLSSLKDAYADDAAELTDQQKSEKRLLFNQYVDQEVQKMKQKKTEEEAAAKNKPWLSRFSSAYGYDSNVNLDSSRRGDGFFQEQVEGFLEFKRPATPLTPQGKMLFEWYAEFFDYENTESLNYQNADLKLSTEDPLANNFSLRWLYDVNYIRYTHNDQLTNFDHKFKASAIHTLTRQLNHQVYISYDLKDFRDRKALDSEDLPSKHGRDDDLYELGYAVRWAPTDSTFLGTTVACKLNDSNDQYNDISDYEGYKLNGYIYQKLGAAFSTVFFAGYDHKDYPSKVFEVGSSAVQRDDFFYLGDYFYWDIANHVQAFLSYLYKQNYSKDSSQEYSGYTVSLGLSLTF